jgi:hypothetical protein
MRSNDPALVELSSKECGTVSGGIAPLLILKIVAGVKYLISGASLVHSRMAFGKKGTKPARNRKPLPRGVRSDARLKANVRVEGTLPTNCLTVYSWEYKNLPGERFVGVMAQDLLARDDLASAVFTFTEGPFKGFYGVNYDQLGLRCLPAEAFNGDVNSLLLQEHVTA